MDIMESPLGRDIQEIFDDGEKSSDDYWRAEIIANGQTLEVLKVITIDNLQDFEENFGDVIIAQVLIGEGTYTYRVFPYMENLQITLYREPRTEKGNFRDSKRPVASQRYRATLIDPQAPVMTSRMPDEVAMNLRNVVQLKFQLQDFFMEQLFTMTHGTIYRKALLGDIVRHVLTLGNQNAQVDDKYRPTGVEMVEAANLIPREQTPIPHGTRLVDVPQYLHQKCGGIYPTGFSYYLCRRLWYVFPPYDTTRFKKAQKTLTLIRVPSNRMPNVERTYMQNGNNLKVVVTGEVATSNDSEALILNNGNGVRFADASKFVEGFTAVEENKALIARGENNNELTSIERKTGINNATMSQQRITTNQMVEFSRLAARDGSMIIMEWENSNPDLLYPGMPVKIVYLDKEEVKEVYGVLLKAHSFTGLRGQGLTSNRHFTSTALAVFVTRRYQNS